MITQKMTQGKNEIRIETAESLEDAKKNNFNPGEYSRFFVNGKPTVGYMSLIQFMVAETQKNKQGFIADKRQLMELRKDVIKRQNTEMRKQFADLKKQYAQSGMTDEMLKPLDDMIDKIDEYGVRVAQ